MAKSPNVNYMLQRDTINDEMKILARAWCKIKKQYTAQLKSEPKNWKGIGSGSELAHLQIMIEEAKEFAQEMLKGDSE